MWRTVVGIIAGLVTWALVATLLNFGLRLWLPGYVEAEPLMAFTLVMKVARLALAAFSGVAAGAIVASIAPASRVAPWITGLVMLILFLPIHVQLWNRFPIWYHLTFLLTLAPLIVIGALLRSKAFGSQLAGPPHS
jgi:hypothetical protein